MNEGSIWICDMVFHGCRLWPLLIFAMVFFRFCLVVTNIKTDVQ